MDPSMWTSPPTIVSFSAEPPVIRGHGRSHASRCLFVRDQEPSCASHFRPCWRCCRHKEETKSQSSRCSYLRENASIRAERFHNPSDPFAAECLWQSEAADFDRDTSFQAA